MWCFARGRKADLSKVSNEPKAATTSTRANLPPWLSASGTDKLWRTSIETLVAEYPGDGAWARFVATFPELAGSSMLSVEDGSLARVLQAELGTHAATWLIQPVRALEHRSPVQVLTDHPQGAMAVRSIVMRMPR